MQASGTFGKSVQHSRKCTLTKVSRLGVPVRYSSLSDLLIWERRFVPTPTVRPFRRGSNRGSKCPYYGGDGGGHSSRRSVAQTAGRPWRARCANTVKHAMQFNSRRSALNRTRRTHAVLQRSNVHRS